MRAGDLNRRVRIDQRAGTGTLNDPLTWAPLATVWCNVKMLTGKETLLADADVAQTTASIRIRYRTDITNGMRAVLLKFVDGAPVDDVVFNILSPLPDVASREYTDLACSAFSNNG
ncbi:phage head closure protein [Paraburkholderia sp. BCC1885]|uniref:phage head closure protein n=1 Tax=Paraburkholderia sp. BCC1885 TaxID=2562669 RepID=UPI0016433E81|nr:phage head closure protein [Paraburkholderia sp. BCC1885]